MSHMKALDLRIALVIGELLCLHCTGTTTPTHVDWSATGAMLGGVGTIAAALGTLFVILLTRKYVRINADLLKLNRASLDALLNYVVATQDIAQIMRHQTAMAAADVKTRIEQEHEPFRHLINRMLDGVQRVQSSDLIEAFHGTNLALRPNSTWFIPPDYSEKIEKAKNVDGVLHLKLSALNEPPEGEFFRIQQSLGKLAHVLRPEYADVPQEAHAMADSVRNEAQAAIRRLLEIVEYVNERAERLRAVASASKTRE
jgi:hypothetical protein